MKTPLALILQLLTVSLGAADPDPALSPFGIGSCHTNNRSADDDARWVPQMTEIGLHFCRTPATSWSAVEPEEGKFNWEALDKQIKYLEDQKMGFGAILVGTPKWNTLDRPGTLPVNNLKGWSQYVSEVAKHLQGKVKYFEVWNEPPNGTGKDQTPADYAKIVAAAYDAVKAVSPKALVGLAAKSVHVNYLEQAIKSGAKDHFDYIVLHPYETLNGVADNTGSEAVFMSIVPTVRKMLAAQNPSKVNAPIIFTELGSDAKKGTDHQAHALVKAYTMGIAQGVACIQWFEARDGDSGPMGLLDRMGAPRPSYTALSQMIQQLGQHPTYLGWVLLNDKAYGFVFQGAKGMVLSTWSPKGAPEHFDFGAPVQIVDPLTGKASTASSYDLTVAPVLVSGVPEKWMAQAKANKTKPFPWGGDFSKAKAVSITMGEKNAEAGLHTRLGSEVAAAVLLYGGSARVGNIPGGNTFMVDPNFLCYTSTPIEISAVVRLDPAGKPATLNLEYESTSGSKKAEPYVIPDNKEWHTVKWKIDDAEFVSMYGFNFRLNSGSYLVQSVTVTKITK